MGRKSGREMKKLMLAVSLSVLALVLAIIAFFMITVVATANRNIERNQDLVIKQSAMALVVIGEDVSGLTSDPQLFAIFNPDIADDILAGNWQTLYDFITKFTIYFYPIDYVGVIKDGELVSHETSRGHDIDPAEMSLQPSTDEYQILNTMGGKEGYFVSQFFEVEVPALGVEKFYVNVIVDRTEDLADVRDYFEDQRNDLLIELSIASGIAIILSLLLTTFGLRFFTRKYVVKPIEELNHTAEGIADGSFEGEVEVDEDSAYAALQGLLRSGQKVLRRFDQELGDQGSRPSP